GVLADRHGRQEAARGGRVAGDVRGRRLHGQEPRPVPAEATDPAAPGSLTPGRPGGVLMSTSGACPDPSRLRDWLDNLLTPAEYAEVSGHVETCDACQHTLDVWTAANASWAGLVRRPGPAPDPALQQAMDQLRSLSAATVVAGEAAVTEDTALDFLSAP